MSEPKQVDTAHKQFRQQVTAWAIAMEGDDDATATANSQIAELDALAQRWVAAGSLRVILEPLLRDEDPNVRCAASGYLLRNGGEEQARPVLEALAEDDDLGLAASTADSMLMAWEQQSK